jgi:alkanesulfonate monooxygenase SsuD/methylene tetrahydromethanopterin reductase-like flavin-dependent oxidoreductase (luciferase family)
VKFGVHTGPQHIELAELLELWQELEELGYDWISVWDHLYPTLGDGSIVGPNHDSIVALTALAMTTKRPQVGCLVWNVTLRHPALLAHAAASLSQLSGGRLVIGLGAGWFAKEQTDIGIPFPPPGERVSMLEEAVEVVSGLLSEETFAFRGRHFVIDGARCEPKPVDGRVPIWVGGFRPRVLRVAGRKADGFNIAYVDAATWGRAAQVVRQAASDAGRDPTALTGSANVGLFVADDMETARQLCQKVMGPAVAAMGGHLLGNPDDIARQVQTYRDAGVDLLNVVVRPPFERRWLEVFAREVIPIFREPVGRQGLESAANREE